MNLGNILRRRGGVAVTGRLVKFRILRQDDLKNVFIEECEALLFPVSADREVEVLAAANEACKRDLRLEQQVQVAGRFLAASLRDPEKPQAAFVFDDDVDKFIACLSVDELNRLHTEYKQYMADEYAPAPEPTADTQVRDEAIRFSSPGQGSP